MTDDIVTRLRDLCITGDNMWEVDVCDAMGKAADEIERLREERNRLITDRDNHRTAALYLYRYITDHVAIIGDKEIKAWHVARDLYKKARGE